MGGDPLWGTYDPANGDVYVTSYTASSVSVVNGGTNTVAATISLGSLNKPLAPTYDSFNGYVYVPESDNFCDLVVISGQTNQIIKNISFSCAPHSITVDTTNGAAYVPVYDGYVGVVNGLSSPVLVPVGTNPLWAAYDSGNNLVYVTNSGSNNVSIINASTNKVAFNLKVGTSPGQVTFDRGNGYIYVVNSGSGNVSVINGAASPTKNSVIASVTVGSSPTRAIYDSANGLVYVPNNGSNNVSVINGTRLGSPSKINVGTGPAYGTFDRVDGWIYIPNYSSGNVSVINGSSNRVLESIPLGSGPRSSVFDGGNGNVYIVNSASNNLSVIPTAAVTSVASVRVGTTPTWSAFDSWNGWIYQPNNGSNNVSVINGSTNSLVTSLPLPTGSLPKSAVFNPVNGRVYVMDQGINEVSIINGTTFVRNVSMGAGTSPTLATVDTANGEVFVFNQAASNATVLNGTTNKIMTSYSTGSTPQAGVFDSKDGDVYVDDSGTNLVSVYGPSTSDRVVNVAVGTNPIWPAYDPSNGYVYVPAQNSLFVSVINGTTVVKNISGVGTSGYAPHSATYDPANGYVYVPDWSCSNCGPGQVGILNGTSLLGNATVGVTPLVAAADPNNGFIYVGNSGGSTVTILNGTLAVGTLNTAPGPSPSGYDTGSGEIAIVTGGSSNITLLAPKGPIAQVGGLTVQPNPTNATISWRSLPSTVNGTLAWGPTTSQGYPYRTYSTGTSPTTVFINYLKNNGTAYQYLLSIRAAGYVTATWSGKWTTGSDSWFVVSGTVSSSAGNHTGQPASLYVSLSCLTYPTAYGYSSWSVNVPTNSTGGYWIEAYQYNTEGYYVDPNPCSNSAYVVSLVNSKLPLTSGGTSNVWHGYWNETLVTWDVQVVNFELLPNFVSPYIPVVTDFSNANSTNGLAGYSTISYSTGTTYTTGWEDCSTGGFGGRCYSNYTSFSVSQSYISENGNDFVSQQYWTSGLVVVDALNRTVWDAAEYLYEADGNPQWPAQQPITDWLTPSTYSSHGGYLLNGWGANGQGRPIYYQYPLGGNITTTTTNATTGVQEYAFSLDASFYIGGGVQIADFSWSQTSSTTKFDTLQWTVQVPVNTTVPTCFVVYGQGGSASARTADIIGIWAYSPSESAGAYTCPLPPT